MKSQNQIRTASIIGMISAGIWITALFIEYQYGLQPPGNGSFLYYLDQFLFFVAMSGYLIMLIGLLKSNVAGNSAFGKISLGVFITGLAALLIAAVVQWVTKNPDFFLFPIGGIFQLLGGLLTGIAVVIEKRWTGWQRFAPLLQGLYYLIVLFLPIVISDQSPSQLTESLWQVTWCITSLALFTQSHNP